WTRATGNRRISLTVPLNYLKRNLGVGKYLPESYAAVSHRSFPGSGQSPALALLSFERAAGETEQREGLTLVVSLDNSRTLVTSKNVPCFKHFVHFDVVIWKPFEVAPPAGGHFLFATNLTAVSIDESM